MKLAVYVELRKSFLPHSMKHKLGLIVGVTMVFLAIVVVNQSVGNNTLLKGDLGYNPYSLSSSYSVSVSSCANANNCRAGYVGDCNPDTCTQEYNTGSCQPGTSLCATYITTCEDTSLCYRSSAVSNESVCGGSNGQCGGWCGTPGYECGWNELAGACVCDDPAQEQHSSYSPYSDPCGECPDGYYCDGYGECITDMRFSSYPTSSSFGFGTPPPITTTTAPPPPTPSGGMSSSY